ncbi:hypothetical protein K3495_g6946 [Podosphaera aphanis]|nr:hypothetical protein K3495_g6946 [Podosphaera aphanis]
MLKKLAVFTLLASCSISLIRAFPSASLEKRGPGHIVKPNDRFDCFRRKYVGQDAILTSHQAMVALSPAMMITDDILPESGWPQRTVIPKDYYVTHPGHYYTFPMPSAGRSGTPVEFAVMDSGFEIVDVVFINHEGELVPCQQI